MACSKRLESFDKCPKNSISGMCVCGGGPWIFLYILLPNAMCIYTNKEKNKKTASQAIESTVEICQSWYKRYITTRWLGDFQMLAVHKSWSLGHYEVNALFNPILHTAWLDNHALTLKVILQNFILVKNPVFFNTFLKIVKNQRKFKSSSKPFYFQCHKGLKKKLLMEPLDRP
jgi:hypothetical protein